ncbi:vWA domain-containing protein [Rubritalea profundi]|uniref:Aerotolerance regulator N-terminal domain-containing protein n=1 Tax=Rubritalea profundi TaxID=1658618 RepID=A0A2S7U0M2_9BACT|nr:VWA domain-containing protein [Rubritalea profundi]PQJ28559.1 hypothetical protein BSZ32_08580 [Rubritalea profundi]
MFLSPIFLIGLLAVGLPVAIHFLTRQKSKVLAWGAMDFLKKSINSASSRRQRLRDRLLLLLRTLAIIFLILSFAQPLISKFFTDSQLETVLIWDISMSTLTKGQDGVPRQEQIRQAVLDQLEGLPDHSTVRVLLAGAEIRWLKDEPLALTPNNRESLARVIKTQQVDLGGDSIAKAILLALASPSENSEKKKRNLVVIHDLQEGSWQAEEKDRWSAIDKRVSDAPNISLQLVDLEEFFVHRGSQTAVVSLETNRDTIATGSKQRFRAILRNYSEDRIYDANVIWLINDREVERLDFVELHPESELNLEQFLSIEDSGSQIVECRLEVANDPLLADNSAFLAVSSTTQLPILIVDDTQRIEKGQILPSQFIVASMGGHLSRNPKDKKAPPTQSRSVFKPRVIRSKDLVKTQLDDHLAVIIANADSLPPASYKQLKDFVASGRGLWLMMSQSDGALPSWITQLLKSLDLDSLSQTTLLESPDKKKPMRLAATSTNSDYANAIAAKNLDLSRAKITKLHQLSEVNFLDNEKLLQTPDGHHVILSIPAEPGRVILQMCDLNRSSTNLPILQTFVPIMRETLRECVGHGISIKNLDPGQLLRVPNLNSLDDQIALIITRPDGSTEQLKRLSGEFQTANTFLPGRYTIRGLQDADGKELTQIFIVKRPEDESNLIALADTKAKQLISGSFYGSKNSELEEHKGKWSLAIWFAILAGLLFLVEAILAHRLAKSRLSTSGRIELKPVY